MLGRSERLEDLFIVGDFSIEQIKCDLAALAESNKLQQIFDDWESAQNHERAKHWKISYLNVRSMKSADGHREDVKADNFIMDTDMFGLGETWLEQDSKVEYDGFSSHFANFGTGKGVAGFTKLDSIASPLTVSSETYSAVSFKTTQFNIIFLYLSSNYDKTLVFELMDKWIEEDVPTAILGDVNENLGRLKKAPFANKMKSAGFEQMIKEPTCETGSLIDHLYVNNAMKAKGILTDVNAAYYSDHDIISLYIPKPKEYQIY